MKDHAPIKRHQALVSFSKDHHFGLLLVWKIRQGLANAIAPHRISGYVLYFFEEDLRQHFKEEEELIFSKLPATDALRQQAEKEHAFIYDLVQQIKQDQENEKLLKLFADTLQDHIRFEERTFFAYMQEQIPESELQEIASYQGSQSGDVDARWKDVFWERNKS